MGEKNGGLWSFIVALDDHTALHIISAREEVGDNSFLLFLFFPWFSEVAFFPSGIVGIQEMGLLNIVFACTVAALANITVKQIFLGRKEVFWHFDAS